MRNNLKKSKKKGFTLVELIAVIAILAILAAIIVPRISNLSTSAKERAARADARTILSQLEVYNATVADSNKTIDEDTHLSAITLTATAYDNTIDAYKQLCNSVQTAINKRESINIGGTPTLITGDTAFSALRTAVATQ